MIEKDLNNIPSMGKIICFDVGERTYGVAVCDGLQMVATPRNTIKRTKWSEDKKEILQTIKDDNIVAAVVGLPITLKGDMTASAQRADSFAALLAEEAEIPVVLFDERMSTAAAEKSQREFGFNKKQMKKNIDSIAASLILQTVLDKLNYSR